MRNIKVYVLFTLIVCSSNSCFHFISRKQYMSDCINRQDNYCCIDSLKNIRYAVVPASAVKKSDSLFFEIMITNTSQMLIDSFNVKCLFNDNYLKGHMVSKKTDGNLTNSYWMFSWKKHGCSNFMKSHILLIEPVVSLNGRIEKLPINEFRWRKK